MIPAAEAISIAGRKLYLARIDYNLTLAKMIALGRYQSVDSDILPLNFPVIGSGKKEVGLEIFPFDCRISSVDVVKEMRAADREPARIEHLLAFGAGYPEIQKQFPISALGSVWKLSLNLFMVSSLDMTNDNKRSLKLDYSNYIWEAGRGFLAVVPK